MRSALFVVVLPLALAMTACGSARFVGRGVEDYQQGQYARSIKDFEQVEGMQGDLNAKGQVRYLVFRGLAHYHLGQRTDARNLLTRGSEMYSHGDPRWINPGALEEMRAALVDLNGGSPGAAPKAPAAAPQAPPAAPGTPISL